MIVLKYATFNFSIEHEGMGQVSDADVQRLLGNKYPNSKELRHTAFAEMVAREHIRNLIPKMSEGLLTINISNLEITEG